MKTYFENSAKNYLPIIRALISDPLEEKSVEVDMVIDTGFQGGVLIPLKTYLDLNLDLFEEMKATGETAIGGLVELRTSKVVIKLGKAKIKCSVYTTLGVKRSLMGREVLKELGLLYRPPKELKLGINL
ncbi:MAG: clan AA aspartic protease [Sulfolobales archaeon]